MFAVVRSGNKQFKVSSGALIRVPYLAGEPPKTTLKLEALALEEGTDFFVAPDGLKKAVVIAQVLRHGLGKKTLVFKKKRRKGYRKTQGHRQAFTELQIIEIKLPSGKVISQEKPKQGLVKAKKAGSSDETSKAKKLDSNKKGKIKKKAADSKKAQQVTKTGSSTSSPVKVKSVNKKKNTKKPEEASLKGKEATAKRSSQTVKTKKVKLKTSGKKSEK